MIFRLFLLTLFLILQSMSVWADGSLDFTNDREGVSLYDTKSNNKKINSTLRKIKANVIVNSYKSALNEQNEKNVCAYNLNETFINGLGQKKVSKSQYEGAIYYLRSQNLIDDVVVQILLNAYNTTTRTFFNEDRDYPHRFLPGSYTQRESLYALMKEFTSKYLGHNCYDDAYRLFHNDMSKIVSLSQHDLKNLYLEANERRIISDEVYNFLERARLANLHYKSVSLKDYYRKIQNIRVQYPLPFENEYSDFVTKANSVNLTHRQQLLAQYSDLQIILMGNLIKKLRTRLESDRIEIWVYDQDGEIEVIPLEPMERFRFALKVLRKEMSQLALNTQFRGRAPSYMDLIAASFELGLVAGSELNELGSLEEIWNPKKTWWDKSAFWVRSFGSVATIMIPPPYGFIPVLALVAIEATMGGQDNGIDDGSLF